MNLWEYHQKKSWTKWKNWFKRQKWRLLIKEIQSLIDLIINEPADEVAQVVKQVVPYNPIQQQSPSVSLPQEKPVRMEDANGDSLFDF